MALLFGTLLFYSEVNMAQPFAKAFYKSKAWRAAREAALRRDGFTCCRCGGHANEVHHKVGLTPKNITDPRIALALSNLESLCHDCHTKETAGATDIASGFCFDANGQPVQL